MAQIMLRILRGSTDHANIHANSQNTPHK